MVFERSLGAIAETTGGMLYGNTGQVIRTLEIDSRTLAPTPHTLFVALPGERHDGHDYIPELYRRGVRAFLVSRLPPNGEFPDAGFCLVEDTLSALQAVAADRRNRYEGTVAAITGSNGKTIVKEWIYQCLRDSYRVFRSPKSYNSQVGVPLSLWMMGEDDALSIIEAGISKPGEMARLREVIRPQIGILTNLGTAHQENFSSLEQKLEEKLKLFSGCERIICRLDTGHGGISPAGHMSGLKGLVRGWSLEGDAPYVYRIVEQREGSSLLDAATPAGGFSFQVPFTDGASLENVLHVLTFCLEMGIEPVVAAERIADVEPVSMRLEMLQGVAGSNLINDAYNADIGGLASALDLMNRQEMKGGRCLILSDMLQSGMEERTLYREIAGLVNRKGVDLFIGIGPAMMRSRMLFPRGSQFFGDTSDFLERIDTTLFRDRIVLVKGSRRFGFERITAKLQLKTHRTMLEIDLDAMVQNLNYFRSLLHDGVRTMVMVKALSYGTGSVEIASLLQYHKVDYLAVAFIDEGVTLRNAGIFLPIIVLNPDPGGYAQMADFRLEPEIFSLRGLKALVDFLDYRDLTGYPVHLKLDTGMHRLGFMEEQLEALLPMLETATIRIASVFTHLAASEEPGHDAFTRSQMEQFDRMSARIRQAVHEPFLRHILNSAGIERFPEGQYDMVRLGIGLHGIGSGGGLVPASSFRTVISQVRRVRAGESVGYSRSGTVSRDSVIATIPVGYADGLDRKLGNGTGSVFAGGRMVPVVGHICMDMTMIDVTGVDLSEGDPVEIFGKNLPVTELARMAGTIPYEILTGIPERVKRVYLQE